MPASASLLAGLSILMIGDSHLTSPDYLIDTLHDDFVRQGAVVHTVGVCGSNPGDWLAASAGTCGAAERRGSERATFQPSGGRTTPIAALIAADKPDLLVVVMGDTLASYDKPAFQKAWAWQRTSQFTKTVAASGTACVWVGPAWGTEGGRYNKTFARVTQVSSFLASNVAPCVYIDSLALSVQGQWPTTDGQHLTAPAYRQWATAIDQAILNLPLVQELTKK